MAGGKNNPIIFGVDFDGTLCRYNWPGIGEPNNELIDFLINERKKGNEVVLITMREGLKLDEALIWCKQMGLTFDAVNDNLPRMKGFFGNNPRKIYANYYIDDAAVNVSDWSSFVQSFQRI